MDRLFVAHDFGQKSERALLRALRLARDEASVRLFHCDTDRGDAQDRAAKRARLLNEAQIMAEEVGRIFLDISASVGSGEAADTILEEAEAFEADLILMGGHGEPQFRDAVFGTTATHVVRHSDRPVLVVQDIGATSYSQMMIAIADPLNAQGLLTKALAVAPTAKVTAVHAYSPTLVQTLVGAAELEQQEKRLQRQIETALTDAGSKDAEIRIEMGEILDVLMKSYETSKPPLLAMGTRARSTYLGSHAVDTLFWCPGDLLVIPERTAGELADSEGSSINR